MERLGTLGRLAQGLGVVRVAEPPAIGTDVVDADLDAVGTVVDVFGPVDAPYVAVNPVADCHLPALLGDPLYVR